MFVKPENLELINLIALIINILSYVWFTQEFWNMTVNKQMINLTWLKTLIIMFTLSSIISSIDFKDKKMIIIIPIFQIILLMGTSFSIVGITWYKEKIKRNKKRES